ncbi:putative 43kDa postsynaptic protein [Rosa chinensis]|uniref:Putative 43kDa postsynaptic protein n=1 Tax=Rosa chinensis TaxID=74649 RepID=A0A2P6S8H3_ROSCH|nr:putative 43kDa postsynaptic protein [Rosa chinensis]
MTVINVGSYYESLNLDRKELLWWVGQWSCYKNIRRCCDVLRIRWESTRSHTKERALMMMETLVQGIKEPSPGVADRIPFCCGIYIPTVSALRKEYDELCVRCGLIGEAIKIFEDLELWDNLIFCYSLLEKKAAAVELIKTWLSETPNDPRLWCSLGDVTNDDACFKKALEVSNDKSARAKRSLARSAYNRGEYRTSKLLWQSAMALNSLYPDGWFALGAAALNDGDIEKALDGFTRAVQLDPENGEAWNNIACLYVALEATRKVLDLTNNKRIDAELLERIMTEVESMASPTNSAMTDDGDNFPVSGTTNAESDVGKSREAEHLVEFLGKVLQQVLEASCC